MMGDKILQKRSWRENRNASFETISNELISEEKMPSLCSYSLTDSLCSDDTIDLEGIDLSEHLNRAYETCPKIELTPMENNFMIDSGGDSHRQNSNPDNAINSTKTVCNNINIALNESSRISLSLHDVSNLVPLQLTGKSTNTISCETILSQSLSSTTKSKDSGFQRSVSCLSLNSSRRNYDHVESKVKAYIKNIKESEALRKRNKLLQAQLEAPPMVTNNVHEESVNLDKDDLVSQIQELKLELEEKALFIDTQQKNYNTLLLKFAEAKNTIDSLRLQRLSLNYSSSYNESKEDSRLSKSFNFEISKKSSNKSKLKVSNYFSDNELNITDRRSSLEGSNHKNLVEFTPKHISTPCSKTKNIPKCLSPVSKIFSSSSLLNKNLKPLSSLTKQETIEGPEKKQNMSDFQDSLLMKSNKSLTEHKKCLIDMENNLYMISRNCGSVGQIDLPNVDPFDKVKKWQASLPSINLLGTPSSSEIDDHGMDVSPNPKLVSDKEMEINQSLSTELHVKCKISELPSNFSNVDIADGVIHKTSSKKIFSTNDLLVSKKAPEITAETLVKTGKYQDSSPESESQSFLPKSSANESGKKSSSKSDDESSSISSSVLGSKANSTPIKVPKRRSTSSESANPNKAPKFILREPRLNYEPRKIVANRGAPQRTHTTPKNTGASSLNLKPESSQRRAWNARNSTSFSVCKEFYFKKSTSLQESFDIMQSMIDEGSSIIKNTLNRSHCH